MDRICGQFMVSDYDVFMKEMKINRIFNNEKQDRSVRKIYF